MMLRVGVVGVGAMGMGMARALLERGFTVGARDILPEREAEAIAAGAQRLGEVDVLVSVVVDAAQTRDVIREHAHRAPVFMMCSTIAPADTEAIAKDLAARGVEMLDAPISGGPMRARAGTLSVMASGSEAAFARCEPVIAAVSAKCFRIGAAPGDGSRMKVVNNMLAAANLAAGCEAMAMASKLGLDLNQAADVVSASSGELDLRRPDATGARRRLRAAGRRARAAEGRRALRAGGAQPGPHRSHGRVRARDLPRHGGARLRRGG